jgi:hypothetical protein
MTDEILIGKDLEGSNVAYARNCPRIYLEM